MDGELRKEIFFLSKFCSSPILGGYEEEEKGI